MQGDEKEIRSQIEDLKAKVDKAKKENKFDTNLNKFVMQGNNKYWNNYKKINKLIKSKHNFKDPSIRNYMENEHSELARIIFNCKKFLSHTNPTKEK